MSVPVGCMLRARREAREERERPPGTPRVLHRRRRRPSQRKESTMTQQTMTEKDMFLKTWDREFETTLRLLRAYPEMKLDLKPAEKLRPASELIWTIEGGARAIDDI